MIFTSKRWLTPSHPSKWDSAEAPMALDGTTWMMFELPALADHCVWGWAFIGCHSARLEVVRAARHAPSVRRPELHGLAHIRGSADAAAFRNLDDLRDKCYVRKRDTELRRALPATKFRRER